MRSLIALVIALLAGVEGLRLTTGNLHQTANQAARVSAAAVSSFFLIGSPVANVLEGRVSGSSPYSLGDIVRPAHADVRAAQKRTWFRQSPKLVEGGGYLAKELKAAVDKEDWKTVEKFFEEYPSKMNGSQKDQVDQYDTFVNDKILRPMLLLSGSFAERGSSDKQRILMADREAFIAATEKLKGSVMDTKESGFFGKTIKAPTGAAQKQQASAALADAKKAYNAYIKDVNLGLMLELNKLSEL